MMNWLKTLMVFGLLILVIQLKKPAATQILKILRKKNPNYDKNITTNEFIKLTKENFDERLKQANLPSKKNGIYYFVKKTDFNQKLSKINKKVNSNKTKHLKAEKKLNDSITSYTKLLFSISTCYWVF